MFGYNIRIGGQAPAEHDSHQDHSEAIEAFVKDAIVSLRAAGYTVESATLNGLEVRIVTTAPDAVTTNQTIEITADEPPPSVMPDAVIQERLHQELDARPANCLGPECERGPSDCHAAGRCLAVDEPTK